MLHNFLRCYICKNIKKVTLINDYIGFDVFFIFLLIIRTKESINFFIKINLINQFFKNHTHFLKENYNETY